MHASLLPKYRGAAPIERAIMNGETETGVTIMRMDEGLDTGPTALQRTVAIPPEANAGELAGLLANAGAEAIVEGLDLLQEDRLTLSEQDSLNATYATKITDEDKVIRWDRGAIEVHDLIRALAPRIGARTYHPDVAGPIKLWRSRVVEGRPISGEIGLVGPENGRIVVYCGSGAIEVLELQRPGGRRLPARDFLRGNPLKGSFG